VACAGDGVLKRDDTEDAASTISAVTSTTAGAQAPEGSSGDKQSKSS